MIYKFFSHELKQTHAATYWEPWHTYEYDVTTSEYECQVILTGGHDVSCYVQFRFGIGQSFRFGVYNQRTPEQALSALEAKVRDHINGVTKVLGMPPYEGS